MSESRAFRDVVEDKIQSWVSARWGCRHFLLIETPIRSRDLVRTYEPPLVEWLH